MSNQLNVGFLGVSEPYWDRQYVSASFHRALGLMREACDEETIRLTPVEEPMIEPANMAQALQQLAGHSVHALVVHCSAFSSGDLPLVLGQFLREHPMPLVLWAEAEQGTGRMKANTFISLQMFSALLRRYGIAYRCVYEEPDTAALAAEAIKISLRAWRSMHNLRGARIGNIGGRSPGFYLCNYDEMALRTRFGVEVDALELSQLFALADKISETDTAGIRRELDTCVCGGCQKPGVVDDGIRVYEAARRLAQQRGWCGITLRCWPEFQTQRGMAACLSLALLNEKGIMTSDEGDMGGLLSMLTQYEATGRRQIPTLLDLIGFDSASNTCWLWHCGASALCLSRPDKRPRMFDSPVLSPEPGGLIGPVLETSLKSGPVTVTRLGNDNCDRMFSFTGEVIDAPVRFQGAYAEIRLPEDVPVRDVIAEALAEGWEYHMSLAYTHHEDVLAEIARWLGIPLTRFNKPTNTTTDIFTCHSH
jgi:L-fucose isomerase-like protein